jgi:hypothetical protein
MAEARPIPEAANAMAEAARAATDTARAMTNTVNTVNALLVAVAGKGLLLSVAKDGKFLIEIA